jgi:hypothetical protein
MLDILTQKYQSAVDQDIWNYDDTNDLNILVSPLKDIVIEWNEFGYFQIQKDKIMLNDCVNGHTYTLRKDGTTEDWKKFQDLFIESSTSKLFRIDAPIFREVHEINNGSWEYTKAARPGAGVGTVNNQHFINPTLLIEFIDGIIDPYYYAIEAAIKVAKNNPPTKSLLPIAIPDISVRHILKDKQGYYFAKNFDRWDQSPNRVIEMCIGLCQMLIRDVGTSLPLEFIDDWTFRASKKWLSLV